VTRYIVTKDMLKGVNMGVAAPLVGDSIETCKR